MKVIICEDELEQRQQIHATIINYAMFSEPSIEVVLSASGPNEVLTYLKDYQADCFFLDIELNSALTGIDLAAEIRKKDPLANIIFVTTHAEKLKLTFTYKLAALDFIVKDQYAKFTEQVKESLQVAFNKYVQIGQVVDTDFFQIKIGEKIKNIPYNNIYYFETSVQQHKIELHEKNGRYEFYGRIKEIEEINGPFFRCHKSYIVNINHIKEVDKRSKLLTMSNGALCPVSFRLMKELLEKVEL
ncbi:MAG: LytTR family DNA-binding domain-containing protein [Candidatus Pristimantibacillus lignocellulolyticus]|uniref:LytTR family DNA-binding domain-containing protein n=1 Tax=Candidatus Pristimantibacillus lignocellulolyticus TaxID=2994561 RepID=A0A9J6ZGK3_9BACL|nr:MAG: LytTR family DNA-binding domain-containing protein [Candidatus Pristimantibacillus lignocellulolyticus]